MVKLYDKRYVHFEYDAHLIGKHVVAADSITELHNVIDGTGSSLASTGKVTGRSDTDYPFCLEDGECYRFCYYDPHFEFKKAYNEGKKVECRPRYGAEKEYGQDDWEYVTDEFVWQDDFLYRIPEDNKVDEGGRLLTNRQLAMWLAKGYGECSMDEEADVNEPYGTDFMYDEEEKNDPVRARVRVRKWDEDDWHIPTVGYCFPGGDIN